MKCRSYLIGLAAVCLGLLSGPAAANNIAVTNVGLHDLDTGNKYTYVIMDLSWENSWRMDNGQRDAAWVFVKYRPAGSNQWYHATLATNGSIAAGGSTIDVAPDGKGAFVYQAAPGAGNVNFIRTRLRWNYGTNGLDLQIGDQVDLWVSAIEMVYIPQGSFYLGSGGTENGRIFQGGGGELPLLVSSDTTICANETNCLWGQYPSDASNQKAMGGVGTLAPPFPNGFRAFYCMKYEISQGQYAAFLNNLAASQASNRYYYAGNSFRHTISGSFTNYTAGVPDRACNFLSWPDGCAYADWAGLRPMTELEFEKACRGGEAPVPNEYAWGSTNIHAAAYTIINDSFPNATVSDPGSGKGNAWYNPTMNITYGPVRCGLFAASKASPTREEAGATFYGVMEMSGNLIERCVTIGRAEGRLYQATHGDGILTPILGMGNNNDWPGIRWTGVEWGIDQAGGSGLRGGEGDYYWYDCLVGSRIYASWEINGRSQYWGFRCVRTAP